MEKGEKKTHMYRHTLTCDGNTFTVLVILLEKTLQTYPPIFSIFGGNGNYAWLCLGVSSQSLRFITYYLSVGAVTFGSV
jgi:hypothetical protein